MCARARLYIICIIIVVGRRCRLKNVCVSLIYLNVFDGQKSTLFFNKSKKCILMLRVIRTEPQRTASWPVENQIVSRLSMWKPMCHCVVGNCFLLKKACVAIIVPSSIGPHDRVEISSCWSNVQINTPSRPFNRQQINKCARRCSFQRGFLDPLCDASLFSFGLLSPFYISKWWFPPIDKETEKGGPTR